MSDPQDQAKTVIDVNFSDLLADDLETDHHIKPIVQEHVGNYRIVGFLRWAQGQPVFRGMHLVLGHLAQIHVVRKSDGAAIEWLDRYTRILVDLQGFGIPMLYDAYETETDRVLAIQHIDGMNLRSLVASGGPMPAHNVVALLRQLLPILDRAHRSGVIFRDLHPQKLCLHDDSNGRECVFFTDLETAGFLTTSVREVGRGLWKRGRFQVRPTDRAYVPPEVLQGAPLGIHSDLFMLGILTVEMLTGGVPTGPIRPPKQWGEGLSFLVGRLLDSDPAKRFPSAYEAFRYLEDVVLPQVIRFRNSEAGLGIMASWSRRIKSHYLMATGSGELRQPAPPPLPAQEEA